MKGKVWTDYGPMPTPREVEELVNRLKKPLQGKSPLLQSMALADIVAMYFAGHPPVHRAEQMEIWLNTMRSLIGENEKAILKHYGKPEGWDPQ